MEELTLEQAMAEAVRKLSDSQLDKVIELTKIQISRNCEHQSEAIIESLAINAGLREIVGDLLAEKNERILINSIVRLCLTGK